METDNINVPFDVFHIYSCAITDLQWLEAEVNIRPLGQNDKCQGSVIKITSDISMWTVISAHDGSDKSITEYPNSKWLISFSTYHVPVIKVWQIKNVYKQHEN